MQVLKFSSKNCQPCKQISNLLDKINTEIPTIEQDVYADIELSKSFNIRSVPVLIALKDGLEVERLSGSQTQQSLQNWYNKLATS